VFNSRKILIVDDNADAAEMLAMLLASYGHAVQTAENAETALQVSGEFQPDVFLLDIGLRDTDGYAVARSLRSDARFRNALIVALTGYSSAQAKARSLEAGFDHHFVKPADVDRLLSLMETQTQTQTQ